MKNDLHKQYKYLTIFKYIDNIKKNTLQQMD